MFIGSYNLIKFQYFTQERTEKTIDLLLELNQPKYPKFRLFSVCKKRKINLMYTFQNIIFAPPHISKPVNCRIRSL